MIIISLYCRSNQLSTGRYRCKTVNLDVESLPDAELAENVTQDLVVGDLAGDLTQVEHAFADVQ